MKKSYFLAVRMCLLIMFGIYGMYNNIKEAGISVGVFLLLALFISAMATKELVERKGKAILLTAAGVILCVLLWQRGQSYLLWGVFWGYECLDFLEASLKWYWTPIVLAFIENRILEDTPFFYLPQGGLLFMMMGMIALVYAQHNHVIKPVMGQVEESLAEEQHLKRDMDQKDLMVKTELKKGMLTAQNQILEERAELSQKLHDKLGHSINGSIYQLEAIKVIMDKEPETSKKMIQAVIDQMRAGMDEIRAILRKEKADKNKFAMMQLYKLCEDCEKSNVEAELNIGGDSALIREPQWEVILDNAYEAVSNALKYSKCTKIQIKINVLNQIIRCSISDNGVGCNQVVDGMGISGMRVRVRKLGGTMDLETMNGFVINMLLPIGEKTTEGTK